MAWLKFKVLHPFQSADAVHHYLPYSCIIIGWAIDTEGPCKVELWYGSQLIESMVADISQDHDSAKVEAGQYYREACGWSFTPGVIPASEDETISFDIVVIGSNGRRATYRVSYAVELAAQSYHKTVSLALRREISSIQSALSANFSGIFPNINYIFYDRATSSLDNPNCHSGSEDRLDLVKEVVKSISNFFPIANRNFYLLKDDSKKNNPGNFELECLRSIYDVNEVCHSEKDFFIFVPNGCDFTYHDELYILLNAIKGRSESSPMFLGAISSVDVVGMQSTQLRPNFFRNLMKGEVPQIEKTVRRGHTFMHVSGPLIDYTIIKRIIIIKMDNMGDIITSIAPVEKLKSLFKGAHITMMTRSHTKSITHLLNFVDDVIEFPGDGNFEQRHWDLAIDLRIDLDTRQFLERTPAHLRLSLYPLHDSYLAASESYLTEIGIIPRPSHEGRQHTHHISEQLFRAISRLEGNMCGFIGIDGTKPPIENSSLPAALESVRHQYCLVNAGIESDNRSSNPEFYAELLGRIYRKFDLLICLQGSDAEASMCEKIATLLKINGVPFFKIVGTIPAEELASIVSNAAFFVGIDSGPKHLACFYGIAGVAIHSGRHSPVVWGAVSPAVLSVYSPVTCSPCLIQYKKDCFNGMLCMKNIELEFTWVVVEISFELSRWRRVHLYRTSKHL